MSERTESTPVADRFEDSPDTQKALDRLIDISRLRSQAHEAANLFRDLHIDEIGGPTELRLRKKLARAKGLFSRWTIMAAHEAFRTVDLARIENQGDWDATAHVEREIGELALQLFMQGCIDGVAERDSPEAKLRIRVDPALLTGQGLIAIRRKRLMLATKPVPHEFADMRPAPRSSVMIADTHMEIDKVSEFVLDFERLYATSPDAAARLQDVADRDPARTVTDEPDETVMAIEAAINRRDPMLTPAVTTYYADRKYKNVRKLGTA